MVGGYLSDAAGWRWLYWIQIILAALAWFLITFTVPETYAPTILARRAKKLRKEQNNDRLVTEQDLDTRPFGERLRIFLVRPLQLLFLEPIVFFLSVYMSVLYGLLYMFFVAYPIVFQGGKGYSAGKTGLMFIPLAVGVLCSAACSPFVNKHYLKLVAKSSSGGKAIKPEARLIPMMWASFFIPVGLFIFAWTSYPDMSAAGPAMGGFPVGFGFIFLYNSCNNYLGKWLADFPALFFASPCICSSCLMQKKNLANASPHSVDTYQHQAASALAAKTFLRSLWGACVVLFTTQMYDRLGYQWASSLLAFIALACCGIPFVFYFKGEAIRRHSKFAYTPIEEETSTEKKTQH